MIIVFIHHLPLAGLMTFLKEDIDNFTDLSYFFIIIHIRKLILIFNNYYKIAKIINFSTLKYHWP